MGAIHFSIDIELVKEISRLLPLDVFVETGTYEGRTIERVLPFFRRIFSIEFSEEYFKRAQAKFSGVDKVEVLHGDSGDVLANVLPSVDSRSTFYWLDAHWCASDMTDTSIAQCPLLRELKAIPPLGEQDVIAIDDARLYIAPPGGPHFIKQWPRLDHILRSLYDLSDKHTLTIYNDVILFYPEAIHTNIAPYLASHVVDLASMSVKAKEYDTVLHDLLGKDEEIKNLLNVCAERSDLIDFLQLACDEKSRALNEQAETIRIVEKELQEAKQQIDSLSITGANNERIHRQHLKVLRDFIDNEPGLLGAIKSGCLKRMGRRVALEPDTEYSESISRLAGECRFHFDAPGSWIVDSKLLLMKGWIFRPDGTVITGIRARVGTRIFQGEYGIQRRDTADFFDHAPGSLQCGFEIAALLPAGLASIFLEIQDTAGEWQPFFFTLANCRPKFAQGALSRFASCWRLARFFSHLSTGFGRAWACLREPEKNWARRLSISLGIPKLGDLRQHPPRPMRLESFPKTKMPTEKLPKLTVVTPSYNQARFLRHTMDSVLQDPQLRVDYIVQDGGSKDDSVEVIESFASRLTFWESAPDNGQADAVRKGFLRTDCGPDDVMAYINSDDVFLPGALRYVSEVFARNPDLDVVYGHRILIDERGMEVGRWVQPRHDPDILGVVDYVPQETLFWRKRIYDLVGGIDPSFQFALDWDLLLRFQEAGARFKRLPYFLACFRIHAEQKTSAQMEDVGQKEIALLRRRIHGRDLSAEEIQQIVDRAQTESAILTWLLQKRVRI